LNYFVSDDFNSFLTFNEAFNNLLVSVTIRSIKKREKYYLFHRQKRKKSQVPEQNMHAKNPKKFF